MNKKEKRFWVYAIKSESTSRIYIGQTSNLDERIRRHNHSKVYSTKSDRPWRLIAFQVYNSRSQAMWIEKEIKNSRGKRMKWLEDNKLEEPTPRREAHRWNSDQQLKIE